VAYACYPSYRDQEYSGSKPAWVNSSRDPISRILYTKKAGRGVQMVECLASKCEVQRSNPITATKKQAKEKQT
jgi:hypothetical protein